MKKLYLLAAASMLGLSAGASNGALTFNPAEGSTTQILSSFTITFEDYASVSGYEAAGRNTVTHVAHDGEEIEDAYVAIDARGYSNTINCFLYPSFTIQGETSSAVVPDLLEEYGGEYTITIDADILDLKDADGNVCKNSQIVVTYTLGVVSISDATVSIEGPEGTVDQVTSAKLTISPTPVILEINNPDGFYIRSAEGMGFAVANFAASINADNTVSLTLAEPYIDYGTYYIYVEEGALTIDGLGNEAVVGEKFNVSGSLSQKEIIVTPTPDTYIDELGRVFIEYKGYVAYINPELEDENAMGVAALYPYMTLPNGSKEYLWFSAGELDNSLQFGYKPNGPQEDIVPFTAEGTYTLTIPKNFLYLNGEPNEEPYEYSWVIGEAPVVENLYLVGSMTDWKINPDYEFTFTTDGNYILSLPKLEGSFKISTAAEDGSVDWETVNFGGGFSLENGSYALLWNGNDMQIAMTDLTLTLTYDAAAQTCTMEVDGTQISQEEESTQPSIDTENLDLEEILLTWEDYESVEIANFSGQLIPQGAGKGAQRAAAEAIQLTAEVVESAEVPTVVVKPVSEVPDGEYELVIAAGSFTLTTEDGETVETEEITATVKQSSSVASLATEEDAEMWFNLQGVRVDNPGEGIFIRVANSKAEKVVVK